MLCDVAALVLGFSAAWLATALADGKKHFGYFRAEVLAALANGGILVAIALVILIEAARRLSTPVPISGLTMTWIAFLGGLVNLGSLAILHERRHENISLHSAWLQVTLDLAGSIGTFLAGI